ncbi:hypothetical protein G7Y89_g6714 [Cudoniella acicularis]|uniref:Ferritin n=1 Tax=Cudoniella acicularis TaxID=354080 RepID=A0A8H4RLQ7_9HELO|nr:hypothetical protein G7Y89_g6714 [Cudoniella acicularis]
MIITMKSLIPLATLALSTLATAKNPITSLAVTDVQLLNYILTVTHLENALYKQALANFTQADFIAAHFPDPFYSYLRETAFDEGAHGGMWMLLSLHYDASIRKDVMGFGRRDETLGVLVAMGVIRF